MFEKYIGIFALAFMLLVVSLLLFILLRKGKKNIVTVEDVAPVSDTQLGSKVSVINNDELGISAPGLLLLFAYLMWFIVGYFILAFALSFFEIPTVLKYALPLVSGALLSISGYLGAKKTMMDTYVNIHENGFHSHIEKTPLIFLKSKVASSNHLFADITNTFYHTV